ASATFSLLSLDPFLNNIKVRLRYKSGIDSSSKKLFSKSQLTLVAECPDNHETILTNDFENNFFEDESIPLLYLNLTLMLFKNGSNESKEKVADAIKYKVQALTNFDFIDQMAISCNWDEELKQNIKQKILDLKSIIEEIAGKFVSPFHAPLIKIHAPQFLPPSNLTTSNIGNLRQPSRPQFHQSNGFNQAGQMGGGINPAPQLTPSFVTVPKMKLLTKEEEASKHYICELSNQIMTDPVSLDGPHFYQRSELVVYIQDQGISPVTYEATTVNDIKEEHNLKAEI
ncbi:MAG: hypothetical protein EZS28_048424, partial [Streblomastix strix]